MGGYKETLIKLSKMFPYFSLAVLPSGALPINRFYHCESFSLFSKQINADFFFANLYLQIL